MASSSIEARTASNRVHDRDGQANHADRHVDHGGAFGGVCGVRVLDCLCRQVVDLWFLGALSLVACYGTAMLRSWSQYLVYLLTVLFIAGWCYSVYAGAAVGFFSFFFSSHLLAVKALAPGFALVVLSCVASWNVFSHFRRARRLG